MLELQERKRSLFAFQPKGQIDTPANYMKKNFLILSVLFALTIYAGCSSTRKNSASDTAKNNAAPSVLAAGSASEQAFHASDPNSSLNGETRNGAYNSQISVSFDGRGNKIENRYFDNHPRLAFLLVTTPVKGEQQVTVFGKNGQSRKMSVNQFNDFLNASPDEIADAAGILEPVKPVAPPPQIATKIEPVQTESSIASAVQPQPSPEETTPVEINKNQPAVETKPSPVQQAKQSAKESENTDNLKQF